MPTTINEKIKMRRKELGLSLEQVANALGVNRSTVMRYESKDIGKMPVDIVVPLSKVLQCSPQWLMGWEELEDAKPKKSIDIIIEKLKGLTEQEIQSVIYFIEAIRKSKGI